MTGQGGLRADLNVVVGPWATDAHAGWRADDAEGHLDRFGASIALVRHSFAVQYDAAEGNRRLLAEIAGSPRLLPAFVLGPLESGEHGPAELLPASLTAAGVRAVWLYPRRHGWDTSGPEATLLLGTLRRCGLPVFIDLDETDWRGLADLAAALPDLDIVVTGLGYRSLRQALPVLDRHPRLNVDLSYTAALDGIELLVGRYGADRVLLGTGAPIRDAAAPWFLLERSDLDRADRAAIAGSTAARLLSLPDLGSADPAGFEPDETPDGGSLVDVHIVDAHAHLGSWPSSWLPHTDAPDLLTALRRTGTSHAVVSHMAALWADTTGGNEAAIAAAESYPDELSVYLVANPHHPQDIERLHYQLTSSRVRGLKVHPDTHHCALTDTRYEWIWQLAEQRAIPVLAHSFAGTDHSDPYLFGAVAERHPELNLLVGHSGATVDGFRRTIEVARQHPNLHAETCGSWMTGRWLRRLIDALGANRVVHGTDACLIDPRYAVGRVLGAGLDPDEQALVLGGNARRVLGLPEPATTVPGGH